MKSSSCFKKNGEPLSEYLSELDAFFAAKDCEFHFGKNFIPYACKRCRMWHLSPSERHTPSTTCDFCQGANGEFKESYLTESQAIKRAWILEKEQGVYLRAYECPYHNGWHLTKQ